MKLAVVSDLHTTAKPCRSDVDLAAQAKILSGIFADMNMATIDAVLYGGDIYDGHSTAEERRVVWEHLQQVARLWPTIVIRGNHDDPLDIEALRYIGNLWSFTKACIHTGGGPGGTWTIGCIPWPARKVENGSALLADVVRGIVAERPDFILGHLDLVGAKLDGGQESTGKVDSVLTVDDFGGIPTALGHYHKRNGLYTGSIRQMKFGDDNAKGFGIYDTDAKSWEWFGPYGRQLHVREFKIVGDEVKYVGGGIEKVADDALVRIRYEVPESERETARAKIDEYLGRFNGRVQCVVEPVVIADTRTRGTEVAAAVTPADKLRAFWGQSRPARADEILRKMEAVS